MPVWKLNLIPFGFARLPMWVLAEDQALERPSIAAAAAAPPPATVAMVPTPPATEAVMPAPPLRARGLKRFVDRIFDALVRYGERSYENKRRSGRLNHYFY